MAKKSKNKPTLHDQKVIAARLRNEYMGRIKYYIDLWLGEKSFSLIPQKDHDFIFLRRYTTPRIEVAPGVQMSKKTLDELKEILENSLNSYPIDLGNGLPEIKLKNFLTYFMTIYAYFVYVMKNQSETQKELADRYRYLWDNYSKLNETAINQLNHIMVMLGVFTSYPDIKYYWNEIDFHSDVNHNTGSYWIIRMRETATTVRNITVKEEKRPAFRIGTPLPDEDVKWCWVNIQNQDNPQKSKRYPLYMQAHALNRMFERLDFLDRHAILYNFYASLIEPIILFENGKILIQYSLFKKKTGYFMANIVEGKLLIRTFLFITNEGTPEARKLLEIAGLGKLDIKYWNIDKLRKFVETDIITNPVVKNIFIEAGCGDLFSLDTANTEAYKIKEYIADDIQKYLGLINQENADDPDGISEYQVQQEDGLQVEESNKKEC